MYAQRYSYAQFFGPNPQLVKIIFLKLKKFPSIFSKVHCRTCDQNTKTKLKYVVRSDAWLHCILIAFIGLIKNKNLIFKK